MKSNIRHINPPSLDEIRLYHEGKLSPSRAHDIELLALENDLVSDALEGFEDFKDWNVVPSADSFRTSKGNSWIKSIVWISAISLAALTLAWYSGIIHILMSPGEGEIESSESTYQVSHSDPDPTANQTVPVDSHVVTQNPECIQPELVKADTLREFGELRNTPITPTMVYEYVITFESGETDNDEPVVVREGDTTGSVNSHHFEATSSTQYSSAEIYHVKDYKVVDYRELRQGDWNWSADLLGGTPASQESKNNKEEEPPVRKIPYITYVENAVKEFADGNYKLAFTHFNTILDQYPGDVNAQFYGGMCCYQTAEYDFAEELFRQALVSEINTFHEDAEFYLAKTYLVNGQSKKAKLLLNKIKNNGGFYSKQAGLLLFEK